MLHERNSVRLIVPRYEQRLTPRERLLQVGDELVVTSQMPQNGVVFSDGIETDYLEFNSGDTHLSVLD